jgi:hypothetical protein
MEESIKKNQLVRDLRQITSQTESLGAVHCNHCDDLQKELLEYSIPAHQTCQYDDGVIAFYWGSIVCIYDTRPECTKVKLIDYNNCENLKAAKRLNFNSLTESLPILKELTKCEVVGK